MPDRTTMNNKPVLEVPAKTVLNFDSGFSHKLLCDGPTFTTGDACAYRCAFCYVPAVMHKRLVLLKREGAVPQDANHFDVVLRRKNALATLQSQLTGTRGKKHEMLSKPLVCYASPLVDVAANIELADETFEACKLILHHTKWHIRLLSKSTFLPRIAKRIKKEICGEANARMIYGVSTGTFDDRLAAAFEQDCPKVSKRIESLSVLADMGCRTFGMICPSLPQQDYPGFAAAAHEHLSLNVTEHVWAEVINVRGESMINTCKALLNAGYAWEAAELERVSMEKDRWQQYSRATFLAHAMHWPGDRLRFLQYVSDSTLPWWNSHVAKGAVLL